MGSYLDKIREHLNRHGVEYEILHHPVAYTAQEVAGAQHIPGRCMIKTVIVKASGRYLMCLLPAIHLINFDQLKELLGTQDVRLAREDEIAGLFPESGIGSEPPFGSWYGMEVYADSALQGAREVVFNAGTHTDTVRMLWSDYKRVEHPRMMECWIHI